MMFANVEVLPLVVLPPVPHHIAMLLITYVSVQHLLAPMVVRHVMSASANAEHELHALENRQVATVMRQTTNANVQHLQLHAQLESRVPTLLF